MLEVVEDICMSAMVWKTSQHEVYQAWISLGDNGWRFKIKMIIVSGFRLLSWTKGFVSTDSLSFWNFARVTWGLLRPHVFVLNMFKWLYDAGVSLYAMQANAQSCTEVITCPTLSFNTSIFTCHRLSALRAEWCLSHSSFIWKVLSVHPLSSIFNEESAD